MITKQYLYYFEEDVFMKSRNEINQGIMDAGLLKKDIHTLLVKKSEAPFDYTGELELCDKMAYLFYEPPTNPALKFIQKFSYSWCYTIKEMLKSDIKIWDKAQNISEISLVADKVQNKKEITLLPNELTNITFLVKYR